MTSPVVGRWAAALAAVSIAACGRARPAPSPADEEPAPAIPVRTAPVEHGPFARPVRAAGVVAVRDEWDLAFEVRGVIARVTVRDGDHVRRGQVLAALDTAVIAADLRQARAAAAKADRELARARALRRAEAVALAVEEDAQTGVAIARAALESAEVALRRAVIVAPDDGWVDRRLADPGEVATAGQPVLHVSGAREFVVRASLPGRDALGLAPGTPARVTLDARPDAPLAGRIGALARSASRGTGTFEVEVRIPPPPGTPLLAGLTAKVEIDRNVEAEAAVPLAAVQDGDGASGAVFVVEGDHARRVPVRIAFLAGARAVLSEGLAGAAEVITEGTRVVDGSRVRIVR